MTELKRFKDEFLVDLSEDFLSSDNPAEYFQVNDNDTEIVKSETNITDLDSIIEGIISNTKKYDAAGIDQKLTIPLHKSLKIDRARAADFRMWNWLSVVKYPELICHRWKKNKSENKEKQEIEIRNKDRFYGVDRVRHTFARLWWAAELTVDQNGDYSLTEKLIRLPGFQDLYENMFGRAFCGYKPAIESFISVLGEEKEKTQRDVGKKLNHILTTITLESLTRAELDELMKKLRDELKKSEEK